MGDLTPCPQYSHTAMKLPTVEKAFLCMDLRTGTLVIGICNIIAALLYILYGILGLVALSVMDENSSDDDYYIWMIGNVVFGIYVGYFVIDLIVASLLVNGARTRSAVQMMPWIIITIIWLCLNVIVLILWFITLNIISIIFSIFWFVIGGYCFVCVWSFRAELKNGGGGV